MKIYDGNIFPCDWAKEGAIFKIWLVDGKGEALADNFTDAEDAMMCIIEERYECASPIITYLSPSPEGALPHRFSRPNFVSISGVKQATLVSRVEELFSLGKCASCGRPKGERTEGEIIIDVIGAAHDALYIRALKHSVFSGAAVERFGLDKIEGALLRRVKLKRKSSNEYFEIVSFPAHLCMISVSVRGLTEPIYKMSAKHCSECGFCAISYLSEPYYIECFRQGQLDNSVDVFISESTGALCLRGRIWRSSMSGEKLTSFVVAPVGFARNDDIDSNVSYRELSRRI